MPITPYHFGPSGFLGLVFRRWIDLPVFVLANVIVDIEVLVIWFFGLGQAVHRYFHTLLVGAAAGTLWGAAAYPSRQLFKKIMQIFKLPYETGLGKMIIAGILGVWCHIIIDAIYHSDVRIFWLSKATPLYGIINKQQVEIACAIFFIPAIILYVISAVSYAKRKSGHQETRPSGKNKINLMP